MTTFKVSDFIPVQISEDYIQRADVREGDEKWSEIFLRVAEKIRSEHTMSHWICYELFRFKLCQSKRMEIFMENFLTHPDGTRYTLIGWARAKAVDQGLIEYNGDQYNRFWTTSASNEYRIEWCEYLAAEFSKLGN